MLPAPARAGSGPGPTVPGIHGPETIPTRPADTVSAVPDDPFTTLGLEPRFDLDASAIERAYLTRVARLHPDLAAADPDAPGRAASLNDARAALADPERRAEALLARLGGPGKTEDKSLPAGFLAHILETREAVEEAAESGDPQRMELWRRQAAARREEIIAQVASLFASARAGDAATLRPIREKLNAWRYVERLVERLDAPQGSPPPMV